MYTTSYIRKKGKYYHLVFENIKNKKKISKSRSAKTDDEELALKMLEEFENECLKLLGISEVQKPINKKNIMKNFKDNVNLYDRDVSFCDFIYGYIKMRYKTISDETYSAYLGIVKNSLIPFFFKDNKKIKDINVFDIEKYYYHELNVRCVSANTVIHYHNYLTLVFKYALKLGVIQNNPMLIVEKPKKERYIAKTYNSEEINMLLDLLKKDKEDIYFGVLMACYFGLRRSEVIGLKWSSVNFVENTISITSTVTETNLDGKKVTIYKDKTKSISSLRTFVMPEKIKDLLLEMKQRQEENKKKFGRGYLTKFSDYIYVDDGGNLFRPNYLTVRFGKFLKKYDLSHIRFHDLRHSCATMLYQNNVNVKDIQAYMGHSSSKTTMDIYVHLMNKNNISTVSLISDKIR